MEVGLSGRFGRLDLGAAFGFPGATACPINGLSVRVKRHQEKAEDRQHWMVGG
jgi:Uri superfamily endonuclease